ncbi:MAG: class D beta-lactamase [Rhodospirillum sp.]|nr:class D beta-lactamase [Rhodospirillum sp.]MCF8491508.1 class D beta-lactamase [Rhodospirillum sp.]
MRAVVWGLALVLSVLTFLGRGAGAAESTVLCTVAVEAESGAVIRKEGEGCEGRVTSASTVKIAIALMGYDAGFLKDEAAPELPFKEGYVDWRESWRQPTGPARWIRESVVWYSQRIMETLGRDRVQAYVDTFHYGNRNLSGDPGKDNGLTTAWLSSSLKISPMEQVAFLRAVVGRTLPLGDRAYDMTARITDLGTRPSGWWIHGKTGSGLPRNPDGTLQFGHAYGWFVGWAEREGRTVVFARLTQDNGKQARPSGPRARDAVLKDLFSDADGP